QIVRDAGAVTATEKAQAIEAYFLTNFTYDLNVAAGSSITDINTFLQRRSGYCEQFAATFAAMARVLGIPSRVAIGYRSGTYDPVKSEYHVTGRDAHAWPEVYIAGQGWVRFEPTPSSDGGSAAAAPAAIDSAVADAALAPSTDAAPTSTAPAQAAADQIVDPSASSGGTPSTSHDVGRAGLVLIVTLLVTALSAPVIVDRLRRRRGRRRVRHDPRGQIALVWHDALRWLRIAGVDARATETPLEVATRAAPMVPSASSEIVELAQLVTAACYAEDGPEARDIEAARDGVETIERCAKAHSGRMWRLRYYVALI
ncbi:MAG: transglutaminase domain-containing protein, partial [Actinobacteria bacterium]